MTASTGLRVVGKRGATPVGLRLLGGFDLVAEHGPVALTGSAQRLFALLALARPSVTRTQAAGVLWPDRPEPRAVANVRAALWRVPVAARHLIVTSGDRLCLSEGVPCDTDELERVARRAAAGEHDGIGPDAVGVLSRDLLPGWYDEWVLAERQRLSLLRVHALETLCLRWAEAGRHVDAVQAGAAAVAVEPLRESAHRALAAAHLAEGNTAAALRNFTEYEAMLRTELGIAPTEEFRRLIGR